MKVLAMPRGTGKTRALMTLAHRTQGTLVVATRHQAKQLYRLAQAYNESLLQPITYDDFIEHRYLYDVNQTFLVDDVDLFLKQLAGDTTIAAVTITTDERALNEK